MSRFIRSYRKSDAIVYDLLESLLRTLSEPREGGLMYGQQNDAHEFISRTLGPMMSNIGLNTFEVEQRFVCVNCNKSTEIRRHAFTEIIVPVLHDKQRVDLQIEVDKATGDLDFVEDGQPCEKCRNVGARITQKEMKTVPPLLMIA